MIINFEVKATQDFQIKRIASGESTGRFGGTAIKVSGTFESLSQELKDAIAPHMVAMGKARRAYNSVTKEYEYQLSVYTPRVDDRDGSLLLKIVEVDNTPEFSELAQMFVDYVAEEEALKPRSEARRAEIALERQRAREEREAKEEAEKAERKAKEEAARLAQMKISWKADGTAILNLKNALFAAAERTPDTRFSNWCLELAGWDAERKEFAGVYVESGTVEITNKERYWLVAVTNGSRNSHYYYFSIVGLVDGKLVDMNIDDSNEERGWQLRMRDQVLALLSK